MKFNWMQEPVRVEFHLDHGYTQVILERTIGIGFADGGISREIPTYCISPELRTIGSRFILSIPNLILDDEDCVEDIREALDNICIYIE